jgi:FKBP-type peptidyl-prolyl cis-trans isomerase FklB
MRLLVIVFLFAAAIPVFSQSKKELEAEVQRLKAEVAELKKPKEVNLIDRNKKVNYGIGVLIGNNIKMQPLDTVDLESIFAGISDVVNGKIPKMDRTEANQLVQACMQEAYDRKSKAAKEEGEKFLEQNKTKEGVKTTASGLQYKVLKSGTGKMPTTSDNVTVHYIGKLINGQEFDSSVKSGQPATFGLGQVIPGWTEALQLMKEGDKFELYIPSELAYGERGSPPVIPANAVLVFEVELLKVN